MRQKFKPRFDPKKEAGRVAMKMPEAGFEYVFTHEMLGIYFQLWERGRHDNTVMTISSVNGTTYHELVNVRPTWGDDRE